MKKKILLILVLLFAVVMLFAACDISEEKPTETQTETPTTHTHTAGAWVTDKEPTCTEAGSRHQVCADCGETIKTETIPAKGHTEVKDAAIVATCTTSGLTEGKHCSVCGATIVAQQVIPAKGHTEVKDAAVAATCTTSGLTEGKHCSVCGATIVAQQVIPAKGHTPAEAVEENRVETTFAVAGGYDIVVYCSICGAELSRTSVEIPAQFNLKFVVDGTVYDTVKTSGNAVVSLPQNPSKNGYDFDGWYWDKDTWQKPFTANSLLDAPLSSDMNVYAKFSKQIRHFTGLSFADREFTYDGTEKSIAVSGVPAGASIVYTGNGQIEIGEYSVAATVSMEGYETVILNATLKILPDLSAAEILSAPLFTMNGQNLSLILPNATESFSFIGQITVSEKATWQISTDIYGINSIPTKTVPLQIGNNTFYLLVTSGDTNTISFYTVSIRRHPIYTVSFDCKGGSAVSSQAVEEESFATLPPDPIRIGYTFAGWDYDFAEPIMADTKITANWGKVTYNITYQLNGGTNAESNPATYTIESNTITFAKPTKAGYTFTGWSIATIPHSSTGAKTVTASWTPIVYAITYQLNGGTNAASNPATYTIESDTITLAKPTKTGYTFSGWSISTIPHGSTGAKTVTASWTPIVYTITYNMNGGTNAAANPSTYTVASGNSTLANPTRTGYTFAGWYSDASFTTKVTQITASQAKNLTFYAKWTSYEELLIDFTYYTTEGGGCEITGLKDKTKSMIVIPDCVTRIRDNAFEGCTKLASITIGNSVTYIGERAFYDCKSLTSVYITDLAKWCKIGFGTNSYNYLSMSSFFQNSYAYGSSNPLYYAQNLYLNGKLVTNLVIPSDVTSIAACAFYNCKSLTSVTIGNSVTRIGHSAFSGCSSLTSITIPDSVTSIGGRAFSGCSKLRSITIPDSLTSIGYAAFSGCASLTSIIIPDSVTSIGDSAFSGCTGLTSVTIPDRVTSIGQDAFENCTSLTSVTIPDGVTSIGNDAFEGCKSLTSVTIPDSVTSIGYEAFYNCTSLTSVYITDLAKWCGISFSDFSATPLCYAHNLYLNGTLVTNLVIPNSVKSIGDHAFRYCTGLTSVTIPDSVTSIGEYAFSVCSSLTSVTIGNSVKSIGEYAFCNCTGLMSVTIGNSVTGIGDSAFRGCTGLTSVTIGNSVTGIGKYAFYNCTKLTSVTIGNSVTSIGDYAFFYCTGLTSVTIPDSVTGIGSEAFYGCKGLTSVTIGNGVKSIGRSAFYGCTGLTSVTIGNSVTSIGDSAFYNCTGLTSVYITDLAAWCNISFGNVSVNPLYYAHNLYLNGTLVTNLVIPDSVTSIGKYAFYNCTGLTSVTIGNSVTSIGEYAFYNCTGLTSVTIPNSVTSIGDQAFEKCTGLTSVTIPDSVTSIGDYAFWDCTKLTSVTIGNSVTSIGREAFSGCKGLTSVTIGNSVTSIGYRAFYNCTGLTSVTIPDSVTSIGYRAFEYCTGLTSVTIPDSVTYIDSYAFSGCSGLKSITIPFVGAKAGVTASNTYQYPFGYIFGTSSYTGGTATTQYYYGSSTSSTTDTTYYIPTSLKSVTVAGGNILYGAFSGCTGLTSVTIPNSVTSIGDSAFSGCTGLTSVTIGNSVTSIGKYAFSGCKSLTSVTIPDSVTSIGEGAFSGCTGLTSVTIVNSVTSIGAWAFYGCTGLTSVTIPDSVTSIGYRAFCNCTGLKSIHYQGTKAQWNAIYKSSYWNNDTGSYTIYCADGNISK